MRLKYYLRFVAAIVLGNAAQEASAQDVAWTHYGLRPLGMGNAYVSVVDDYNTLFYNPAGLARLESWDGELLNPILTVSKNTTTFASDLQKLASGSASDPTDAIKILEKQSGKTQSFAFSIVPHLVFRNFGLGLAIDFNAKMGFHRYPSVFLDVGPQLILPIAFAMNFLENRLSVGFGVKAILKGGIVSEFSVQNLEALSSKSEGDSGPKLSDFVVGGLGIGTDFGILFTPIKTMSPTLGVSIADFGGTEFEEFNVQGEATGKPDSRLPAVNVGFSMKPWTSERQYVLAAIDVHQSNQPIHFSKKLNLGAEWGLGKQLLKVQVGLHQGYLTGGLQFDVGLLNIKLVSYAEELGAVAGTIEDRRYALQFKLVI
jgi:hypothetical protein